MEEHSNTKRTPYLFNGKELDEETGLYYYGARYYDPQISIWLSVDPLAEKYPAISPYAYVNNNPIKYVDPNGEFIGTVIGTIAGAVVGGVKAALSGDNIAKGAVEGAVVGFITGAAVDLTVATGGGAAAVIVAGTAGGGLGGALGDLAGQITENLTAGQNIEEASSNINFDNTQKKAANGAIGGLIGGSVGLGVAKVAQAAVQSTKAVQKLMSNNITETAETLTQMGASSSTIQSATSKITSGMGNVGRTTANSIVGFEAGTAALTTFGTSNTSVPMRIRKRTRETSSSGGYQIEHQIKTPSGIL